MIHTSSITKKLLKVLAPFAMISVFLIWIGIPLAYAVLWSLVNPDYPWSFDQVLPSHISLFQWQYVFEHTSILTSIANSFALAFASTLVSIILALPTAYALGRTTIKGRESFKIIMMLPMVFPKMALALVLGRFLFSIGLSGTYTGVVIAHTLIGVPYMLRILTVSFESVPQDMLDAAANLGAGKFTRLLKVYIPMIMPGLIAGAIFTFINSMEEFNLTFIIGAPNITTIPTVLYTYLGEHFLRTRASVVSLIMLIPNLLLLMFTEKQLKTEYMGAALGKM